MNELTLGQAIQSFVFLYPLLMSFFWMGGALWYWFHYERKRSANQPPPKLPFYPKVALVVPCFNEEADARETVLNLLAHNYPNFEVIAINDGSTDRTGEILDGLAAEHPKLRVLHQAKNQGKAVGLNMAALLTDAEYVLGIDGDALLSPNAASWMLSHMLNNPSVGAVTGNPRIRTRSTILGRLQVGEFSSIVGLIKRAQRTYGKIFTVSGVCACFRKDVLHEIGYWAPEALCEDIDISWRIQMHGYDIRFEPAATVWILMPETLKGLWKQRVRWSMGGTQALFKYAEMWASLKHWRLWPIYAEYVLSTAWAYAMAATLVMATFSIAGKALHNELAIESLLPGWTGLLIAITCLFQTALSLWFDRHYDKNLWRNYLYSVWYPLAYWLLTTLTSVYAFPKALIRQKGKRAIWVSPDRGLR